MTPNLPENRVSLVVVDGRISIDIEKKLEELEIKIIKTKKIENVCNSIAYHPDIMLHHLGGKNIIIAPNINSEVAYDLENNGFNIIIGKKEVGPSYPYDVTYNAARIGDFLVCNVQHTDETILENSYNMGLEIIDIKQGYSKCSICIVGSKSIITSDKGIYNTLSNYDLDCCIINPGSIELFNMNYGFIGGASGLISQDEIAFYGDITLHSNYERINEFILKCDKKKVNLSENIVNDYGSLIPLKEYSIMTN